jgi:DNA-directed RNA polymerase specialized sigma24 family protein
MNEILTSVFETQQSKLRRIAATVCGDTLADDAVQNAALKLFTLEFDPAKSSPLNFVIQTVYWQAIALRTQAQRETIRTSADTDLFSLLAPHVGDLESFRHAWKQIKPSQRAILRKHVNEIPVCKMALSRARKALKLALAR